MIKLIIFDYYGVTTKGSYQDTCRWLSKKYHLSYELVYQVIYHKYFSRAALGKITERESLLRPIREFGLRETPESIMLKHISFQVENKPVVRLMLQLQKDGYKILILSKNTPPQFKAALKKLKTRAYFKNIINTFDLKLPKASIKTIRYILNKFKVKPEQTIMIDDQDFNLSAAKKIGVKVILYKNLKYFKHKIKIYLEK